MKRKKMVKLINEAGALMDAVHGALPINPSTKEVDDAMPRVSEDEIRAMQATMVVLCKLVKGQEYRDAMHLAIDIITTCGLSKLSDEELDAMCGLTAAAEGGDVGATDGETDEGAAEGGDE